MKERGMIFNGDMVRALLDGRKTQTRRAVKGVDGAVSFSREWDVNGKEIFIVLGEKDQTGMNPVLGAISCPFGMVGARIWVRETWAEAGASAPNLTLYRANYPEHIPSQYENVPTADSILWRPSIHMPRWASRILLEITEVRVERLNSISERDAVAEGIKTGRCGNETTWRDAFYVPGDNQPYFNAATAYGDLWSSIYGEDSWAANPWVWVIEFKRIDGASNHE